MPQVPHPLRRARAARLRAAGEAAAARFAASQVGRTVTWLAEARGGHTEHFARLRLPDPPPAGALLRVRVVGAEGASLWGEAA
jgi:threonylcarbamoyladenosine tRNA methylthiotransferase MtaB